MIFSRPSTTCVGVLTMIEGILNHERKIPLFLVEWMEWAQINSAPLSSNGEDMQHVLVARAFVEACDEMGLEWTLLLVAARAAKRDNLGLSVELREYLGRVRAKIKQVC